MGPTRATFGYAPKLLKWLEANRDRFDGVMVNGLWQYCSYAAWKVFAGKIPYVVFPHGMLDPYFKRRFPLKHLKKWMYWTAMEHKVLRDAFRVLFTTQAEERAGGRRASAGTSGMATWFPLERVKLRASQGCSLRRSTQKCSAVRGRRFLLFLGRIHPKKGCDLLIEAFARAANEDAELHLVMAGPDQQGWCAKLQAVAAAGGIGDRVHWPGMLTGEAKWGSFFAAEAFILPSHQENFGIAVAEALGCSRPVLLSDKVNIAEEIAGDGAGLMETDTEDGTLRLLRRWIGLSDEARLRMNERARACFLKRYDMQQNAKTIMRLFEAVPQHRPLAAAECS